MRTLHKSEPEHNSNAGVLIGFILTGNTFTIFSRTLIVYKQEKKCSTLDIHIFFLDLCSSICIFGHENTQAANTAVISDMTGMLVSAFPKRRQ